VPRWVVIEVSRGVSARSGRAVPLVGKLAGHRSLAAAQATAPAEAADALDADERVELHRLAKEVRDTPMDREILHKAAAYFAQEAIR
jgi:hypothetical protein